MKPIYKTTKLNPDFKAGLILEYVEDAGCYFINNITVTEEKAQEYIKNKGVK